MNPCIVPLVRYSQGFFINLKNSDMKGISVMENLENQDANTAVQDTANTEVVNQPDVKLDTPVVPEGGVTTQPAIEQNVPYERFKEVNDKSKANEERAAKAERERDLLTQQILAASQTPVQQPQMKPQEDYFTRLGLGKDDYPTVEQQRQIMYWQQQDFMQVMQAQKLLAQKSDFYDVVGRPNPVTGQVEASESLKKVISQDPELRGIEILAMSNPVMARIAYQLAFQQKKIDELAGTAGASAEFLKQQAIRDKTSVVSAQAAGGSAGTSIEAEIARLNPNDPKDAARIENLAARMRAGEFDTQTQ